MMSGRVDEQRRALLEWYQHRRSAYPWRFAADPYAILVSEFMLQQTQAPRVVPIFERFLGAFPTVGALAAAPRSAVVRAWEGLGYNRRAVSLSLAARAIVESHGAEVPNDPLVLRSLPGIGPYTAAAVASIAYGIPIVAIDTNVRRVAGRVLAGRDDEDRSAVEHAAAEWLDPDRPGDWNQAVMDLGRTSCRPRPVCGGCPLRMRCAFVASGAAPRRKAGSRPAFAGSRRQVRGDVVRVLRSTSSASLASLGAATGHPAERIAEAVTALVADGIIRAGRAAAAGAARGRVRLAG